LPTVPAINLTGTGIDLHSGDAILAHITYDGTTLVLTLTDTVTLAHWSHSFAINIPATVGDNIAYIGFTGSTGAQTADQEILSWTYVSAVVGAPVLSPASGVYATAQMVSITDPTPGAKIFYTTNGTVPTASSTPYTGPISVNSTETLTAIALFENESSALAAASYTIASGTTSNVLNFSDGFAAAEGPIRFNRSTELDGSRLQLTNGGDFQAGSAFYATPVDTKLFTTDFTFQLANPNANGFTFTIQNARVNALGGNGDALGYAPIGKSVAIKFDLYNNAGDGPELNRPVYRRSVANRTRGQPDT
jgi:hypothetical protein